MDKRIVVFDFDGTLVKDNSFITFAIHALGIAKCIKTGFLALPLILKWKLRFITNSYAKERIFSLLYKNISSEQITTKSHSFRPKFNQKSLNLLKSHLQNGDTVYIVSASLDLWLKDIAYKLGTKLLCTTAEVDAQNVITGHFSSPNCYGPEKVRRLLQEEPDRDRYYLIVYGDSKGDADLWSIANESVNVRTPEL